MAVAIDARRASARWKVGFLIELATLAVAAIWLLATPNLISAQTSHDPAMVARQEMTARENGVAFYRSNNKGIGPNDIGLVLGEVRPPDRIFVHARIEEIQRNAVISDNLRLGDEIAVIDRLAFRSFADMAEYVSNRPPSTVLNLGILRRSSNAEPKGFAATAQVKASYSGPERERKAIEALQGILGPPTGNGMGVDRTECTWNRSVANSSGMRHCSSLY